MGQISIGDLAQGYMLRSQNTALKARMNTLVQDLASGRATDVAKHLGGSYAYLADVERSLALSEGYADVANEARTFASSMQTALGLMAEVASDLGLAAMSSATSGLAQVADTTSEQARQDFESLIAALNVQVGGRSVFSGAATDQPAMQPAETILEALRTALAGQGDLAGINSVMDAWFAPGGDFDTIAYGGAAVSLAPMAVSPNEYATLDLRADNAVFRETLRHVAMAALASDSTLGFAPELRTEILAEAGEDLIVQQDSLTATRADLGYAEARIERGLARAASERTSLLIARSELLSIDPYEAATELETVQFHLESLYAVTVRLSRLSLVEHLR